MQHHFEEILKAALRGQAFNAFAMNEMRNKTAIFVFMDECRSQRYLPTSIELPFDYCCFEFNYGDRASAVIAKRAVDGRPSDHIWLASFISTELLGGWELAYEPFIVLADLSGGTCDQNSERATFPVNMVRLALSQLSTKEIPRERIEPDAAKNKIRKRLGRPPILPYTIIRTTKCEAAEHQGGTHASPRAHMRRGHFRTYASGRRVFVRPCCVKGDPGKMPVYAVKSAI